jgi:hypothetical protein
MLWMEPLEQLQFQGKIDSHSLSNCYIIYITCGWLKSSWAVSPPHELLNRKLITAMVVVPIYCVLILGLWTQGRTEFVGIGDHRYNIRAWGLFKSVTKLRLGISSHQKTNA